VCSAALRLLVVRELGQLAVVRLGLALVRAILEAQGGRVDLTSSPGDTTLRVTLPSAP